MRLVANARDHEVGEMAVFVGDDVEETSLVVDDF